MSTQRWEAHRQRTASQSRAEAPEPFRSAPLTRFGGATAFGLTARPDIPTKLATNSLFKDHPLVRRLHSDVRRGSPPLWISRHENARPLQGRRSSRSLPSILSGFARLPLSVPQAPAALSRRAERYDGKRDLHLLHAA